MTWLTPKITINGYPLPEQRINWALTAGVTPYIMDFVIDKTAGDQLAYIPNPVSMSWELMGGTPNKAEVLEKSFDNLYLFDPRQIDPFHYQFSLADARWAWRGKKLYGSYNKTRLKNEPQISQKNPETPESLREQIDQFSDGHYLDWSIKSGGTGKPWSVYEILQDQLQQQGIITNSLAVGDKSYVIENVELNGQDIYSGLAYLLSLSRLQMGITSFGSVYIYSLDHFDIEQTNLREKFRQAPKIGPGRFYKQDAKKVRPSKISIKFEKKQEVFVVAERSAGTASTLIGPGKIPVQEVPYVRTQEDMDEWRVIGARNVIRVPYPIVINKKQVAVGEWVPMGDYLEAIKITETQVREGFFSQYLENTYAASLPGGVTVQDNQTQANLVIGAVKAHYRVVYQIDPYFCQRMKTWEPKLCSVINNYDHYSPPSPLFADCTYFPAYRSARLSKKLDSWGYNIKTWEVNEIDPYRLQPNGGSISVISQAFGIFQIVYPNAPDRTMAKIYPYIFDPATIPVPGSTQTNNLLSKCHLSTNHTAETIISVRWEVDNEQKFNSNKKYFVVSLDISDGEGPELESLCLLETARYPHSRHLDFGLIKFDANDEPINSQILQNIADNEIFRLHHQYTDRYVGFCTFGGFVDCVPTGSIKTVAYCFSSETGLITIVDAREMPPVPTQEQLLTQKELNYLHRQVYRADEIAEIGR